MASTERWLAKSQSAKEEIVAASPVGGQKPPKTNDRLPEPQPSAGATDSGRRSSLRRPPQLSIPDPGQRNSANVLGIGQQPSAAGEVRPTGALSPGLSARETVLSPSRVHMGEGMVVSNLRDSTGTKDLGIVVVKEEKYIPVALAKSQIEKMMGDMALMKVRHQEIMQKLDAQYRNIEQQSQQHYVTFIQDLKNKAHSRIDVYKKLLRDTDKEHIARKNDLERRIDSLQDKLQEEAAAKCLLMEEHRTEDEVLRKSHQDALRSMEKAYEAEHSRLLSMHAAEIGARRECFSSLCSIAGRVEAQGAEADHFNLDRRVSALNREMTAQAGEQHQQLEKVKRELYARRFKSAVDVTVLRRRVESLLKQLEAQAADFDGQHQALQHRFRSELHGVQQEGVRANVEAVVEDLMLCVEERLWDEDKGRLVTASRELSRARTMIDDLESRVMVRDTSIAALQKEVQDGKQALTGLERSKQDAETIIEELKAKMVALTADSDKMEELEGARAGAEKRMQELSTRLQENEYQNEEGRKKEVQELESLTRVRDEDNGKITELQAKMKSLVEDNARLEDALKQVQAETQTKAALTSAFAATVASTSSSSSATQALTDIEALRARMAELQIRLQEATNSQQEDEENKRVHKNTIKVWMTEFEQREGRAPNNQDKAQARDLFVDYRNAESRAKASSDSLAALQQELEAVKTELAAALQRPSASLSFNNTSATQRGAPTSMLPHHDEIARLEARVAELEGALQNGRAAVAALEVEKKTKKAQIKEWMADFEQKEGRPPTNQDKEAVKDLFVDYRKLEMRSKTDAESLAALMQDLEATKAQLAAARSGVPPVVTAVSNTAEIHAAKTTLRDLELKAKALRDAIEEIEVLKKTKKAQIKEWMTGFEQREGRPPTNQDKESVKELFIDYRKYELKTKADTESLGIAQQAIEAAQAEVQRLEAGRTSALTSTQPVQVTPSAPIVSQVENSEQVEDERRRRAAAEEAVRRTERERDQLRDAIYQLQEAMKSLDTSGQINELVKQVRAAQEAAGSADSRSAALEKVVEQGKGEAIAFRQELRKNKKALEEAESRAKEAETELKKIDAALKSGGDLNTLRGARAPGVSEKEVETMRQQIRSMQAMVESGRAAANVLEQKLAIAEEKARVTEDFARSQMEAAKKLQASGGSRRGLAVELAASPTGGLKSVPSEASLKSANDMIEAAILQGNNFLKLNKKAETFTLFKATTEKVLKMIPPGATRDRLNEALSLASKQGALNGPMTLRKAFDAYLAEARSRSPLGSGGVVEGQEPSALTSAAGGAAAENEEADGRMRELERKLQELQQQSNSVQATVSPASLSISMSAMEGNVNEALRAATERYRDAEARVEELERQLADAQEGMVDNADEGLVAEEEEVSPPTGSAAKGNATKGGMVPSSATAAAPGGAGSAALQQKLKTLEKRAKEDTLKIRKLEDQLAKAQATPVISGGGDGISAKQLEKELQNQEKKLKKSFDDDMKKREKEVTSLQSQLKKATKDLEDTQAELAAMKEERDKFKRQAADLGTITQEVEQLRVRAQEATAMEVTIKQNEEKIVTLETQYREETALRKKYWNMMEDMKGKIRVYARCRPFAKYEIERACTQAVKFVDDTTLEVESTRGTKQFIFDTCFTMDSTQDQVFADTRNLIQSCIDGYNVCIFAYGQTGSGKTFTMTGSADMPGLTPRCITELYTLLGKLKNCEYTVTTCFVELYNDKLQDLFYMLDNPRAKREDLPDLEVKLNDKKMVFIRGAIVKPAHNPDELMQLFTEGNSKRKVGGTKMNAESSRSHSIFSVLVEVLNKTTGKATAGKLSLVDLAAAPNMLMREGSERADKTGATDDRLKEAMNINKSLAALGDVISALSQNEKFIPYRNNKLTQLMQDSLGGNAKTLMFVNISPADYNSDETVTSLAYAARVKLITNNANKNQDSEEVAKLKAIIKALKAGQSPPELDEIGPHAPAGGGADA